MNGLYPIIRRQRRPLLPEDPVPAKAAEVVKPETESREGNEGGDVKRGNAASESQSPDREAPAGDTPDCTASSASPTVAPS